MSDRAAVEAILVWFSLTGVLPGGQPTGFNADTHVRGRLARVILAARSRPGASGSPGRSPRVTDVPQSIADAYVRRAKTAGWPAGIHPLSNPAAVLMRMAAEER